MKVSKLPRQAIEQNQSNKSDTTIESYAKIKSDTLLKSKEQSRTEKNVRLGRFVNLVRKQENI